MILNKAVIMNLAVINLLHLLFRPLLNPSPAGEGRRGEGKSGNLVKALIIYNNEAEVIL